MGNNCLPLINGSISFRGRKGKSVRKSRPVRKVGRGGLPSLINGSTVRVRDDVRIVWKGRSVWVDLNARQTSHNNSALDEGC